MLSPRGPLPLHGANARGVETVTRKPASPVNNVNSVQLCRSFSPSHTLFPVPVNAVASWLVRSTPERAVRVRALAGDSVLCSWARHFTLTVPLSTQVYKWVPAICWGNLTKLRGSDLRWTSILSRGSRNTSSRLMLQKPG